MPPSCRFKKVKPSEEKMVMSKLFVGLMIFQTVFLNILCFITIHFLNLANISWFLPVDIITLMIAVIFLSLILLIIAWASARSNASFAWAIFHLFMIILILIELLVSWYTSDVDRFIKTAQKAWITAGISERQEMQVDLSCCGFINQSDMASLPCPADANTGCKTKLISYMSKIRDSASVTLFIDFVLALFIDFAGFAICFHPDVISYDDQIVEDRLLMESESQMKSPQIQQFGFILG